MQVREIAPEELLRAGMTVADVLAGAQVQDGPMLWLVVDESQPDHLAGVLSPFELMLTRSSEVGSWLAHNPPKALPCVTTCLQILLEKVLDTTGVC